MLRSRCFPQANSLTRVHKMLPANCLSSTITSNLTLYFLSFPKPISNTRQNRNFSATSTPTATSIESPLSGLESDLVGYVLGKKKATEVAHLVWKQVVQKGDTAIDATCANGYDTLAMLKMVADGSGSGRVYGIDIQREALQSTSSLLDETATSEEKELVKLFCICHSRMEEIVPENSSARLVAFNLGYLPGGDKGIITVPQTTRLALEAAKRVLVTGGLISLAVYVEHHGGS